jgi:formate hydrogenlyase subunit 6/NADH:ubiquinone oxidoreductase subunit I
MLFKTISKANFKVFINGVIKENRTIAPKATDKDSKGNPVYQFRRVYDFDEIALNYTKTYASVKNFFLPFKEDLSTFHFDRKGWEQKIEYSLHPRVIVGVRACDINGLLKLDNVLMKGKFPNPHYVARRKNTFLIGLDHEPMEDCFCRWLNTDEALHGFDIFLTDIGEKYFMQINSSNAFNLLKNVEVNDINKTDEERYIIEKKRIAELFKTKVDITGLSNLMDIEFESDVWKKWGDKCLSCGSCAMVCPTCYCFTVTENVDVSLKTATKERLQYSCNLVDFAEVAGGHNFRPKSETRLKYRYYHQYRGFVESYDEPKCVGCNRCGIACPAGINPVEVINDLKMEI